MNYPDPAGIPYEWKPNDVILELYEVQHVIEGFGDHAHTAPYHQGGFGQVYKVWHRAWNRHMAVKTPKLGLFVTPEQKRAFARECETWISLGLHPHVATCHYVRDIGGVPRVFSEYADAGTLAAWIASGRLYKGEEQVVLARILDVAIQFAWGLHHAHESGVIHQDVKPLNALMWDDETLKVTDFGISGSGLDTKIATKFDSTQTITVTAGAMTPTHCSPEQRDGLKITRRSDVWSWAVCVLEMFNGGVSWYTGAAADKALEAYLENRPEDDCIPEMPFQLIELLRSCLRSATEDRPKTLLECARSMAEIRKSYCNSGGQRVEPSILEESAESLNNKAISFIDLGRNGEAIQLFEKALKKSPYFGQISYNHKLLQWRLGLIALNQYIYQFKRTDGSYESEFGNTDFEQGLIFFETGFKKKSNTYLEKYSDSNITAKSIIKEIRKDSDDDNYIFNVVDSSTTTGKIRSIEFAWNEDCIFLLGDNLIAIDFRENTFEEVLYQQKKLRWIKLLEREGLLLAWDSSSSSLITWNPDDRTINEVIGSCGLVVRAIEHFIPNQLIIEISTQASFFSRPVSEIHRIEINGDNRQIYALRKQFGFSNIVCTSPEGQILVTSQPYSPQPHSDNKIVIFDLKHEKLLAEFDYKSSLRYFSAVVNQVEMKAICSISNEPGMQIIDLSNGSIVCRIAEELGEVSSIKSTVSRNLLLIRSNYESDGLEISQTLLYDPDSLSTIAVVHRQFDSASFHGQWEISKKFGKIVGEIAPGELVFLNDLDSRQAPYLYLENTSFSELEENKNKYERLIELAKYYIDSTELSEALKVLRKARSLPGYNTEANGKIIWQSLSAYLPKKSVRSMNLIVTHLLPENKFSKFTEDGFLDPKGIEAYLVAEGSYFKNSSGSLEMGKHFVVQIHLNDTTIGITTDIKEFEELPSNVTGFKNASESILFYSSGSGRYINELNLISGNLKTIDSGDRSLIFSDSIAISSDGIYLAFSGDYLSPESNYDRKSLLRIWNRSSGEVKSIWGEAESISEVSFGYFLGSRALILGGNSGLKAISVENELNCTTLCKEEKISLVSVSTCGYYVACAERTGRLAYDGHSKIRIFNLADGGSLVSSFEINSWVNSMRLTRNGEALIILQPKNRISYFTLPEGKIAYDQSIQGDRFEYSVISNLSDDENRFFVSKGRRCDLFEIEWEY